MEAAPGNGVGELQIERGRKEKGRGGWARNEKWMRLKDSLERERQRKRCRWVRCGALMLPSLPKDTEHLSCSLNQTNSHHIPSHPIPSHPMPSHPSHSTLNPIITLIALFYGVSSLVWLPSPGKSHTWRQGLLLFSTLVLLMSGRDLKHNQWVEFQRSGSRLNGCARLMPSLLTLAFSPLFLQILSRSLFFPVCSLDIITYNFALYMVGFSWFN